MSNGRRKFLFAAVMAAIAAKAAAQPLEDVKYDERTKELLVKALKDAFQDQVSKLFINWMKDDTKQPERARTGVHAAMAAYQLDLFDMGVELATVEDFGRMLHDAVDVAFVEYMSGVFRTTMYEGDTKKNVKPVRTLREKAVSAYVHAHKAVTTFTSF